MAIVNDVYHKHLTKTVVEMIALRDGQAILMGKKSTHYPKVVISEIYRKK